METLLQMVRDRIAANHDFADPMTACLEREYSELLAKQWEAEHEQATIAGGTSSGLTSAATR